MSFWDPRFVTALEEELKRRNYRFLEVKSIAGSPTVLYKFFSLKDNKPMIVKVFEEPVNNILNNRHMDVIKKLSRYQDNRIIKVFETGYLDFENESYFFGIFEFVEGKSLEEITANIFWENNSYLERMDLFNQLYDIITIFRNLYEMHNDLQVGNIMLTLDKKLKIVDFSSSQDAYNESGTDADFYLIKNHLMEFFLKPEEIERMKEEVESFNDINFNELHTLIKSSLPSEDLIFDSDKLKSVNAIENIFDFYFKHFDEDTNKPKEFIEKARRTDIISDVQELNTLYEYAEKMGIKISGDWDAKTHSQGINHEIYITIKPDLIIQIIQHEFGETMRISIKINNDLVQNREQVENYLIKIRELAKKEEPVSQVVNKKITGSLSFKNIEDILRTSAPNEWQYSEDHGIYVYKPNVELNIRIRDDVKGNREKFEEEWIENFSDKNAYKQIVRIFYRGSYVTEYLFIDVDGGRMLVPIPKAYNDLRITAFQYKLGRILNGRAVRLNVYDIYLFNTARFSIID